MPLVKARSGKRESVSRVERGVAEVEAGAAMPLLAAGLCYYFDSALPRMGILGRQRILVDADLQNRLAGREASPGKPVYIDLRSILSPADPARRGSG
jgi:hypothetical protein